MVDLIIEDVAFGGKGVGRDNGKAVFVPYVIEGERVAVEIVREKKNYAEADLVEVKESSPDRLSPPCPYFGQCGGCAYQHMKYERQLATKQRQVRDVLKRIAHLNDLPMQPIFPSPEPYGYRNRITVHVQDGVVGFFRRDSNRLIDVDRCPISKEEVNRALADLRASRPRDGHYTLRALPGPRVFTQTNDAVGGALLNLIDGFLPPNQQLLIDAHCGSGFFAKALQNKFEHVIGIDWDQFAIAAARQNATTKETYIAGDVDPELGALVPLASTRTTLIVDPPSTGLTGTARQTIAGFTPANFVYVSCNPSTLARDLKELSERFTIRSVTPLDMFPQTAEIEIAVFLQAGTPG